MDLGATFRASVERDPHALALVDGDLRLDYAQWLARVENVARGLVASGLRPGDRLMTVLQNGEPMCTMYWASQLLGVTFTPANWRLAQSELAYIMADAEPRCAVVDATLPDAAAATRGCATITVGPSDATLPTGTTPYQKLVADNARSHSARSLRTQAGDDGYSIMLYTSGTTGRPKGVPRTHRAERTAALAHVAQNRYVRLERTLGVMPLYHTMGIRSLIAMTLLNGAFIAMPKWDPAGAAELIERERVTNLYLAPTLYYDMLAVPGIERRDLRSLRKLGYAGAPMTPALVERCYARFAPDVFVNHYGSTEVYTFSINEDLRAKPASAGKAGINERVRVVRAGERDPEARCAPGEPGEIAVHLSSPEAFAGYWKRPDADAKAIAHDWYFTGDSGAFDDDGDLFVLGRVDDMIISGGENVYPAEVEDVLAKCEAVGRIAVVGMPDERLGQKIVAFVEPARPGVSGAEIDAYARTSGMTQFKRPREYVFVTAIPQSPSGKILRTKLRAGEYERLTSPSVQGVR